MSRFVRETTVRFEHCDPAGIMFYPRFFALVNETLEDWLAELGAPFLKLHREQRRAVPTVKMEAEFIKPVNMGDRLRQSFHVAHLGRTSCRLKHEAHVDGVLMARFDHTIVFIDAETMRPVEWPPDLRAAMARYEEEA